MDSKGFLILILRILNTITIPLPMAFKEIQHKETLLLINLSILSKLIEPLVQLHMEGEDRRPKTKQNQSILNFIQINESIRLSKAQQSINREAKLLKQINQLKNKNKDLHEKLATEKEKFESVKNILKLGCQTPLPNNPPRTETSLSALRGTAKLKRIKTTPKNFSIRNPTKETKVVLRPKETTASERM